MKNVSLENITATVVDSFDRLPDERKRALVQMLIKHLHGFAKEANLSHAEWRAALAFLHRVGDISSDSRSEFSLFSDVIGLSSLVDLLASQPAATPGSVLGPFHTAGSPWMDNPANLIADNEGPHVLLRGRILDTDGNALPQASIDFWQNASNGMYWQMDSAQPQDNLRCQIKVGALGEFAIATIRPMPYEIPTDGPVWLDLMAPAQRTSWRPAHFHMIVSAPGYRTLVTEVFEGQDPYLENDAVFGVRAPLVGNYKTMDDAGTGKLPATAKAPGQVMDMDFRLARQTATS
jgi:hydroxyquinol 1,2-dioxygenase